MHVRNWWHTRTNDIVGVTCGQSLIEFTRNEKRLARTIRKQSSATTCGNELWWDWGLIKRKDNLKITYAKMRETLFRETPMASTGRIRGCRWRESSSYPINKAWLPVMCLDSDVPIATLPPCSWLVEFHQTFAHLSALGVRVYILGCALQTCWRNTTPSLSCWSHIVKICLPW